MTHRKITALLASTSAILLVSLSPSPRAERIAPIGWESRIEPGFDPPIEYVVVYDTSGTDAITSEEQKKIVTSWGPAAFTVLKKMLQDPAWKDFKPDIEQLLTHIEVPARTEYLIEEARAMITASGTDETAARNLHNTLRNLERIDLPAFDKIFDEQFPVANPPARRALLSVFVSGLYREKTALSREARLQEMLPRLNDTAERGLIESSLNDYRARRRADEPMQRVLDREAQER